MKAFEPSHAAQKVRTAKTWTIILGLLCLVAAAVTALEQEGFWFVAVVMGVLFFVVGGVLEGFTEVVEAASRYNQITDAQVLEEAEASNTEE